MIAPALQDVGCKANQNTNPTTFTTDLKTDATAGKINLGGIGCLLVSVL